MAAADPAYPLEAQNANTKFLVGFDSALWFILESTAIVGQTVQYGLFSKRTLSRYVLPYA